MRRQFKEEEPPVRTSWASRAYSDVELSRRFGDGGQVEGSEELMDEEAAKRMVSRERQNTDLMDEETVKRKIREERAAEAKREADEEEDRQRAAAARMA
ncbi:unnamed protein product, partial [Polarella glacialis]